MIKGKLVLVKKDLAEYAVVHSKEVERLLYWGIITANDFSEGLDEHACIMKRDVLDRIKGDKLLMDLLK